jgi:aryl-alcohol dehydrogenase-like predicted oxidoreductase
MAKTQLKTAALGETGLEISRVGFGAWAIGGGGWEFGWGPQDHEDSIAAIHGALGLGINWIDTAAAYGFGRIHWPIPDRDVEEGWAAFAELKEQVDPIVGAANLELTDDDLATIAGLD